MDTSAASHNHHRKSSSSEAELSDSDTSVGTHSPSPKLGGTRTTFSTSGGNYSLKSRVAKEFSQQRQEMPDPNKVPRSVTVADNDAEDLLEQVEHLLKRISMLDSSTEEERRRKRKLQAALAILEE